MKCALSQLLSLLLQIEHLRIEFLLAARQSLKSFAPFLTCSWLGRFLLMRWHRSRASSDFARTCMNELDLSPSGSIRDISRMRCIMKNISNSMVRRLSFIYRLSCVYMALAMLRCRFFVPRYSLTVGLRRSKWLWKSGCICTSSCTLR